MQRFDGRTRVQHGHGAVGLNGGHTSPLRDGLNASH